jgi:threonine/homoserine/homoserine lactone efflux protein
MNWNTWVLFVVTEAILSLTPGPAALLVVSSGLRGGVRSGVSASLGILAANAMYFAISATSLGAMLAASAALYIAVKWTGSAYLVYLGLTDLFRPPVMHAGNSGQLRHRRALVNGFLLQAANPKAIIFFVALLPQFLNRDVKKRDQPADSSSCCCSNRNAAEGPSLKSIRVRAITSEDESDEQAASGP